MKFARLATLALTALLAACGKPATPSPSAPATVPLPSDPKLAGLYVQTCKTCHGNPATGAPQAGDHATWQPRMAQGLNVLIDHAVNGYKGMPPLGSCSDCSEKDFASLIAFMSGQESK